MNTLLFVFHVDAELRSDIFHGAQLNLIIGRGIGQSIVEFAPVEESIEVLDEREKLLDTNEHCLGLVVPAEDQWVRLSTIDVELFDDLRQSVANSLEAVGIENA